MRHVLSAVVQNQPGAGSLSKPATHAPDGHAPGKRTLTAELPPDPDHSSIVPEALHFGVRATRELGHAHHSQSHRCVLVHELGRGAITGARVRELGRGAIAGVLVDELGRGAIVGVLVGRTRPRRDRARPRRDRRRPDGANSAAAARSSAF